MKTHAASVLRFTATLVVALFLVSASRAQAQFSASAKAVTELGTTTGPTGQNLLKAPPASVPTNYILKPNDEIQIRVFRNADLDGPRRISKDGTIDFPMLGIVNIAGKTSYEAAAHIAALLDKDYIVRPQVFINVAAVSKRHFNVLGEVNTPGTKEFPDDRELDILGAISIAGGYTKTARTVNIMVKRRINGQDQLFRVDAERMVKERGAAPFFIQPNDTILVKERFL